MKWIETDEEFLVNLEKVVCIYKEDLSKCESSRFIVLFEMLGEEYTLSFQDSEERDQIFEKLKGILCKLE